MSKFYITTAILYTNAPVHLGFAMELVQADVLARFHRLKGDDTFFLTGTDEHGSTVAKAAAKHNAELQKFVDDLAEQAKNLTKKLNISNDDFIRTSDQKRHWPSAVKLWSILAEKGDLYKKKYKGLYCIGHESFVKKTDLVNGLCPLHQTEPEAIEEENWFFKLSDYKKEIKKRVESDEIKIVPASRKTEILNVIEDAEDISVSRPTSALKWGIPVPNDPEQVIWVWLDALPNYISALGYAEGDTKFNRFWPADVHLVGKDILRFHALIWPAILLSAGLELPKSIYVHGFINVNGQKMSKTIGNVIDPFRIVEKYGTDVVRYFLLREIPSGEDGDFSYKKLEERYNGDLANGLGNLVQRTITLVDTKLNGELIYKYDQVEKEVVKKTEAIFKDYVKNIDNFLLHEALAKVWELIAFGDKYLDEKAPWKAIKHDAAEFLAIMNNTFYILYNVAWMLVPFLPETANKIFETMGADREAKSLDNYKFKVQKTPPSHKASEGRGAGLFPRIN